LHDRVEVGEELLDLSGHLAADLNRDDRVQVAGGGHGGREGTTLDARQAVFGHVPAALHGEIPPHAPGDQHTDDDESDETLHGHGLDATHDVIFIRRAAYRAVATFFRRPGRAPPGSSDSRTALASRCSAPA